MKKVAITAVKFAISFGVLGYLCYRAVQEEQFSRLAEVDKNWAMVVLSLGVVLTAAVISFTRLFLLMRAVDLPFRWIDAVRVGFLGQLFNLLSVGVLGGDAVKIVFFARQARNRVPEIVASVVADRVVGLMAMLTFAVVAYSLTDFSSLEASHPAILAGIQNVCRGAAVLLIIGLLVLLLLAASPHVRRYPWFDRLLHVPLLGGVLDRILNVIVVFRSRPRVLIVSFGLSLLINICFVMALYGVASGITSSPPSFAHHFVVTPFTMLANAVPLPGGLGGMELALDTLYKGFSQVNLPEGQGFVVALGYRLLLTSVAVIGLFVYLFSRKEVAEITEEIKHMHDEHPPAEQNASQLPAEEFAV